MFVRKYDDRVVEQDFPSCAWSVHGRIRKHLLLPTIRDCREPRAMTLATQPSKDCRLLTLARADVRRGRITVKQVCVVPEVSAG